MRSIAAVIALLLLAGAAWSTPTVYIEPAASVVEQGQVFSAGIRIDAGVDTLTCFLVEFTFDASVLELLSADEGTLFAESGHSTMFHWDTYSPGSHGCNDVTLGFDAFVMCPGELVHLEFNAAAQGTTAISITAVDLRDIRRDRILPVLTEGGLVTVGPGTGIDEVLGGSGPALRCFPNPFSELISFDYLAGDQVGPVEVSICDVSGRVVARPVVSGGNSGLWDGTGQHGRRMPSGVYFIVANGRAGYVTKRVTLVR